MIVTVLYFELQRVMEALFEDRNFKKWLNAQHNQEVRDLKHGIRYFLMHRYQATPLEMSKAESRLRGKKINHSCMYHSRKVVTEVLQEIKPELLTAISNEVYAWPE